ncbi:hypothetical protein Dacet_0702 [Denitrovibrio acetiphilus DSM 12809]|uniref:DUF3987 domain-containing protein n=1 Tax=Denitrovibrio acetiphilus (strain DSM 12809 / NBRC 114555 / N2460) TaxID=522772 RepID=D4H4U4_DENA2|nr:DUF3987 domain-containing protein [Denitrovibrio acetiphilus]ADD67488.1 hypothetical protein Dacet_0702 [Denitrovibrio acetiphilus DSM 12809]
MYKPIQNPTQLEFPEECLKEELVHDVKEIADSKSTELAAVMLCFLVISGNLVGAQHLAAIKFDYLVTNNLFMYFLGISGSSKSVVTSFFMKLVNRLERTINSRQKERVELYLSSCTYEKLIDLLHMTIQGILLFRDEGIGLLSEMGMYSSKGSEAYKSLLNQSFSGGEFKRSTINSGTKLVDYNIISLVMNGTPDSTREILSSADMHSGFIQRILFFNFPNTIRLYSEAQLSPETQNKFYSIFETLVDNRAETETITPLNDDAKELWISWEKTIGNKMEYNVYGIKHFNEFLSKHRPTPVKIASILFHIYNAMGDSRTKIDAELITAGIKITDYLIAHTAYTWEIFTAKKRSQKNDLLDLALINVLEQIRTEELIEFMQVKDITERLNRFVCDQLGINNKYKENVVGSKLKSLGLVPEKKTPGMFYYIDMNVLAEARCNL